MLFNVRFNIRIEVTRPTIFQFSACATIQCVNHNSMIQMDYSLECYWSRDPIQTAQNSISTVVRVIEITFKIVCFKFITSLKIKFDTPICLNRNTFFPHCSKLKLVPFVDLIARINAFDTRWNFNQSNK